MAKGLNIEVLQAGNEKCPVCNEFKLQKRIDDCKEDYNCTNCLTKFKFKLKLE